jgi:hypothetical protein
MFKHIVQRNEKDWTPESQRRGNRGDACSASFTSVRLMHQKGITGWTLLPRAPEGSGRQVLPKGRL